jgi:hypothetical protein
MAAALRAAAGKRGGISISAKHNVSLAKNAPAHLESTRHRAYRQRENQ